ncbi:MAG TPA: hypothetical protein VIJ43_02545, partial [Burkholderiales bacterium]
MNGKLPRRMLCLAVASGCAVFSLEASAADLLKGFTEAIAAPQRLPAMLEALPSLFRVIHVGPFDEQVAHHAVASFANGRIQVISQDEQAVTSLGGDVLLVPGKTVELTDAATPHMRVELTAPPDQAINITRLVGSRGESSIYAGLFRAPAAARQAAEKDDSVVAASLETAPGSPVAERLKRYAAAVYARMLSEYGQAFGTGMRTAGGTMKVAAVSGSRTVLPATRSRSSLMPQTIEIGARNERATPPAAADERAPLATGREKEYKASTLLASIPLASAPVAALSPVATLEPQPILLSQAPESEDIRTLASQLAAAQPLAPPKLAQVERLEQDPEQGRPARR